MRHRHSEDDLGWTKAAIASTLERGDLPEWRELFAAARRDPQIAAAILEVARAHRVRGVLPIVEHLLAGGKEIEK